MTSSTTTTTTSQQIGYSHFQQQLQQHHSGTAPAVSFRISSVRKFLNDGHLMHNWKNIVCSGHLATFCLNLGGAACGVGISKVQDPEWTSKGCKIRNGHRRGAISGMGIAEAQQLEWNNNNAKNKLHDNNNNKNNKLHNNIYNNKFDNEILVHHCHQD